MLGQRDQGDEAASAQVCWSSKKGMMMKMMKGRGGDPVTLIIARCFLCMAKIPSRMHFVTVSCAVGHDDRDPVIGNKYTNVAGLY
jgi:hypothetical protein